MLPESNGMALTMHVLLRPKVENAFSHRPSYVYKTHVPQPLTLREERRLKVFENRVLRRIFGSKRDEVAGEWRKLHNEELNVLYSSPNIVRVKNREE